MTVKRSSRKKNARLRRAAEKIMAETGRESHAHDQNELQRILYELEMHQVELDLQNEELRSAVSDLEIARNKYADLFHSAPVAYILLNKEGRIERFNQAAQNLLSEFAQYPQFTLFSELIYPEDLPKYFEATRDIIGSGGDGTGPTLELRLVPSSGLPLWVRLDISAEFSRGQIIEWRISFVNITTRKQAEKLLRDSEKKFHASFTEAAIGFALSDIEGRFQEANQAYCSLTGYTLKELRTMGFQQLIHPDDLKENMQWIEKLRSWQIPAFTIENRYIRKDGSIVHVRKSVSLITDTNGIPQWTVALIEDITDRKQAEEALAANERRFRALTEKTHEIIAIVNDAGKIDYITIGHESKLHYQSEELVGRNAFELVHPDDKPGAQKALQDILTRQGGVRQMELRVLDSDGSWRWMLISGANLLHDPAVRGIVLNGLDISDRKQNEADLQQIRLDLDHAQEVGQIGSWRMDVRRNILTWSKENYRIFGVPEGEPQTYETFLKIVHPDDREYVDTKWKSALRGEPYEINHRILTGDQVKWVREQAFLEFDAEGLLVGGFGITQDITERWRIEEELRQARDELEARVKERTDKLSHAVKTLRRRSEQLRQMAAELTLAEQRERHRIASVLHDGLQQLLVGAHFHLVIMEQDQNISDGIPHLKKILEETISASRSLAMELHPPVLLRNDLNTALRWLANWMRDMHGLQVRVKSPKSIQSIDYEMLLLLFQSVRELLFNIVKHAGVKEADIELKKLNERILLKVEDKGGGFDPGILRLEEGTSGGYGLFGMRERLIIFGVRMQIESAPGKGSRIKFRIPLRDATKKTGQASDVKRKLADRAVSSRPYSKRADTDERIRIMLVDDQDIVRQGIASLIERESDLQVVCEASNGEDAVSLARKVHPDVVLMDINMPIMNGIRATQLIHEEIADIQIIGLSVFDDEFYINDMIKAGATAFLTKRGEAKELIDKIRSCRREASH